MFQTSVVTFDIRSANQIKTSLIKSILNCVSDRIESFYVIITFIFKIFLKEKKKFSLLFMQLSHFMWSGLKNKKSQTFF